MALARVLLVVSVLVSVLLCCSAVAQNGRVNKRATAAALWLPCNLTSTPVPVPVPALYPLPAVGEGWYPEAFKFPFITQTPLSHAQMQRGLPALSPRLLQHMAPLMRRLAQCKEPVRIMAMGGSFAAGQACCPGHGWTWRVYRWLQAAYPRAQIKYTGHLQGSTTSHRALSVLRGLPADEFPHLLLMGYAINDNANVVTSRQNSSLLFITEEVIRLAIKAECTVMYLVESLAEKNLSAQVYSAVSNHYEIPLVSYRHAVLPEVLAARDATKHNDSLHINSSNTSTVSIYWSKSVLQPHPNWISHMLIKEMIAHFFIQVSDALRLSTKAESSNDPSADISILDPPERAFSTSASVSSALTCDSISKQYSSLTATSLDINESSFLPYRRDFVSDYFKRVGDDNYYAGWEFRRDQPGKPPGWVAESATREKAAVAHLTFVLDFVSGHLSIDYLSSYENAGIVEIWLSELSHTMKIDRMSCRKNWKVSPSKLHVCYDNSQEKINIYPHIYGTGHTQTEYLDTYVDMSASDIKFSQISTKTFNLNVTGMALLHILHRPLPDVELARRKGDKVKILGLTSC
jgi:hypothetical protein